MKKTVIQSIWDFIGFPLSAFLLDEPAQKKLGLTTLKERRLFAVLPLLQGNVLDIGCGHNELIKSYRAKGRQGVGADVFPFEGVDKIVDTTKLPYADKQFDTVTIIAALNHIPLGKRIAVLNEAYRVLENKGRLIVTMINGTIGYLCHKLMWWDFDQGEREVDWKEENYGLSNKYVTEIIGKCGFRLIKRKRFVYGLNNLFIFEK